jgi:hypothetical protein
VNKSISDQARYEFQQEQRQAKVEAEKARLRSHANRSLKQRIAALIPFTITWKTK